MKQEICYSKHADCKVCTEKEEWGFEYIETTKGELYVFKEVEVYTLVFILSGETLVSCNEFRDVHFKAGEMILFPIHSNSICKTLEDTKCIVLYANNEPGFCDSKALREYADKWLTVVPTFNGLEIKPRLMDFLYSVKNYLDDGATCKYMHKAKKKELASIFRAYYAPDEIMGFFIPTVRNTHEFETFVMNNYLKMKGVKEFVDLSGMNLSTFNRKFKTHFKQSPYQWLIKQKSKHIFYALSNTDKSISAIAKEFHFTDASHFNRYCKARFGACPSQIRKGVSIKVINK